MAHGTVPSSPQAVSRGRVPPYSEEAEKGVIGSILLDAERVMDICLEGQLVPESFHVPAHQVIYDVMCGMSRDGRPIDVLTVTDRLKAIGKLETVGDIQYLEQLIDSNPTSAHAEYYIDLVRQAHVFRMIIDRAREAEDSCYNAEENAHAVLGAVEEKFFAIADDQYKTSQSWADAVKSTMKHIEHVFQSKSGVQGVPSGFRNLDDKLHGFNAADMIILAARPSMGKTSLAMNIAEHVALGNVSDRKPRPVGIFSLEMSQEALVMRMVACHARVSAFKLSGGYVSNEIHGNLIQAASALMNAPLYLDDAGGLDILELRARARRMKRKYGIQFLVIDYLQLLTCREFARQGRQIETAFISSGVKAMAKELKIPVLVLSQLNRSPEAREEGQPKLSDLRDSGAIEQDADVVMMLRRPSRYKEETDADGLVDKTLAIVDVVKHRNGPTGEVKLNFHEDYTRFEDRHVGIDDHDYGGEPE